MVQMQRKYRLKGRLLSKITHADVFFFYCFLIWRRYRVVKGDGVIDDGDDNDDWDMMVFVVVYVTKGKIVNLSHKPQHILQQLHAY